MFTCCGPISSSQIDKKKSINTYDVLTNPVHAFAQIFYDISVSYFSPNWFWVAMYPYVPPSVSDNMRVQ